jgi:spore coat polysaccharide biosynthesis predicted glycosyltransferase SpsG
MIGMGHLSRCLHIASCLLRAEKEVIFHIVGDIERDALNKKIMVVGDEELDGLTPKVVVVDRLPYEPSLPKVFKEKGARVILLDNLYTGWEVADVVINPLPHPPYIRKQPDGMLLFEGPAYMPVGEDFKKIHQAERVIREVVKTILVSCGGTDPYGVTIRLAKAIVEVDPQWEVIFVTGRMYRDSDYLKGIVLKKGYRIVESPPSIASLMEEADLALLTFGLTVYEAACCGLPSILFPPTKEHLLCAEIFSGYGASINMGLIQDCSPSMIIEKIEEICRDRSLRIRISKAGKDLVDGEGARRVANIVLRILEGE